MSLNLIYHFRSSEKVGEGFRPASYQVLYLFGKDGFWDTKNLEPKTFISLDELKEFAQQLCAQEEMAQIRLISIQDYNVGLDGVSDLGGLKSIFEQFGEVIVMQSTPKKKKFLGKLFT